MGTKAAVSLTLAVVVGFQEHVPLKFGDVPEVGLETQPEILFPLAKKVNLPATFEVKEIETEMPFLAEDESERAPNEADSATLVIVMKKLRPPVRFPAKSEIVIPM